MRQFVPLVALMSGAFAHALAQDVPLQPGRQVRVTAPSVGLDRYVGQFTTLRDGTLVLTRPITHVPLGAVSQLDVRTVGRRSAEATLGFGLLGTLVGGAAGAGIGSLMADCQGGEWSCGMGEIVAGGVVGAFVGLLVGVNVGNSMRWGRQWVPVNLSELRSGLAPPPSGGVGVRARIAF